MSSVMHFCLEKKCDEKSAERGDCRENRVQSHVSPRCFLGYFSARLPPRFAFFCVQKQCFEKGESRCYDERNNATFLERFRP